jgi:hypothetical protein
MDSGDEDQESTGSDGEEEMLNNTSRLATLRDLIKKDLSINLNEHRLWYLSRPDLLPIEIWTEHSFKTAIKEMQTDHWPRVSFFLTRAAGLGV